MSNSNYPDGVTEYDIDERSFAAFPGEATYEEEEQMNDSSRIEDLTYMVNNLANERNRLKEINRELVQGCEMLLFGQNRIVKQYWDDLEAIVEKQKSVREIKNCSVCGKSFESIDGLVSCPAHSFAEVRDDDR